MPSSAEKNRYAFEESQITQKSIQFEGAPLGVPLKNVFGALQLEGPPMVVAVE